MYIFMSAINYFIKYLSKKHNNDKTKVISILDRNSK